MPLDSHLMWPSGHGGWFYSEHAEFEGGAALFLAEGVRRHERVLFLAEDPGARRWPQRLVDEGVLVLGALDEVYSPLRAGDLDAQRAQFVRAATAALEDGFRAIRVAADNTRIVTENLERWIAWESVADALMEQHPVTGLCGFDRSRLTDSALAVLGALHPRVVAPR